MRYQVEGPLVVLAVMHFTRNLRALFALCCAAAVGSAVWMYSLYGGGTNTNRAYLGTDTRSQCLFIGCALAVGLVLLTQRSHEEGRLVEGELWQPKGETGRWICGAIGVGGALAAVVIWAPAAATIGLSITLFGYAGAIRLGVLTDSAVIDHPEELVVAFQAAIDELRRSAPAES